MFWPDEETCSTIFKATIALRIQIGFQQFKNTVFFLSFEAQ